MQAYQQFTCTVHVCAEGFDMSPASHLQYSDIDHTTKQVHWSYENFPVAGAPLSVVLFSGLQETVVGEPFPVSFSKPFALE